MKRTRASNLKEIGAYGFLGTKRNQIKPGSKDDEIGDKIDFELKHSVSA